MDDINQKIGNSLQLSMEATEEERERSLNLDVGYDQNTKSWEVIIKYSGETIEEIVNKAENENVSVIKLFNEYAIVRATKQAIEDLAGNLHVEYVEGPKSLFFERETGQLVSCILPMKSEPLNLNGKGIIIGILDSGIDYRNSDFRNLDGSTRILCLWDQTIEGNPPKGYKAGTEYNREEINQALNVASNQGVNPIVPSVDVTGHGTEVASIAVGNQGVASESDIIVVKLGTPELNGFPKTTELMQGLDYLLKKAMLYKQPLSVNISFGNTYGSHDGSSLLERFIDDVSNYWKTCICVGAGNEGNVSGHVMGNVLPSEIEEIEIAIDRREVSIDLQLWKFYEDTIELFLVAPNGDRIGPIKDTLGVKRYTVGETEILLYYGKPSPYSVMQEIYFQFIAINEYIDTGIWKIELSPIKIVTGKFNMWLPSYSVLNNGTQFLRASKDNTITIPATATRVISVGAYDSRTFTYADFSGRGEERNTKYIKPDLVAPGVKVQVSSVGGAMKEVSGTSFATPFVTGSAALMMQWGIIEGNDPYLYGEKVKAYLHRGANPLVGIDNYPNNAMGYGALCVRNSLLDY